MLAMDPILYILALITFASTIIGGLVAVKFRKVLQYFFAFSAGALIAITFFDVLPESLNIAKTTGMGIRSLMIAVVAACLFFSLVERFFLTHHHHDEEEHGHIMGPIGAIGLVAHSFLDGAAIGIAFQANAKVGIIVALAVISHDFTDGINTVVIMLKNEQNVKNARKFLFVDAIAPVFGIIMASFFAINQNVLAVILAAFSGQFLYIGAASLLPETYRHVPWKMAVAMIVGVLLIFGLTAINKI
jgi:ZIP family zinc transporter